METLHHVPSESCTTATAQTSGMTHIESNAHSDEEAVVVIARTTQEAIVENLEEL